MELADHFPIEPSFSITGHKAREQTTRRIIMNLTKHPTPIACMGREGLYEGMPRVRHREHVRFLVKNNDNSTLGYIEHLRKSHFTKCYFSGYTEMSEFMQYEELDQSQRVRCPMI